MHEAVWEMLPEMLLGPMDMHLHNIDFLCKMRHREKSRSTFLYVSFTISQKGADFFQWGAAIFQNGADFFENGADFL